MFYFFGQQQLCLPAMQQLFQTYNSTSPSCCGNSNFIIGTVFTIFSTAIAPLSSLAIEHYLNEQKQRWFGLWVCAVRLLPLLAPSQSQIQSPMFLLDCRSPLRHSVGMNSAAQPSILVDDSDAYYSLVLPRLGSKDGLSRKLSRRQAEPSRFWSRWLCGLQLWLRTWWSRLETAKPTQADRSYKIS